MEECEGEELGTLNFDFKNEKFTLDSCLTLKSLN